MSTRKLLLEPGKFSIRGAKRLLQHNLPKAAIGKPFRPLGPMRKIPKPVEFPRGSVDVTNAGPAGQRFALVGATAGATFATGR
jgi:hypothetical protein